MEKKSKKQVIIAITVLLLVTLTLLGITYAYYRTRIIGNENDKSISVTSKVLEITYSDDNAVISANDIEPGDTLTKTFTVSNTGDDTVSYAVIFDNVENSFMRTNDWTFTLKKGSDVVKSGVIPRTTSYVLTNISIDAETIDEYTLEITYANSSEDQSIDMGFNLSLRVNIADGISTTFDSATSGTLLAAIGNDNLISETLTVPGRKPSAVGEYYRVVYVIEETYDMSTTNQSKYYYTYASSYTFNEETGKYTLVNPKVGLYSEICNDLVGKYVENTYGRVSSTIANSTNIGTIYQITEATTNESKTIKYKQLTSMQIGIESSLSVTEDDYGNSLYFRGNVKNNYVNFSGMCWRIVRVQGDGAIKLTLADNSNLCNSSEYSSDNYSGYIHDDNYVVAYKFDSVDNESDIPYDDSSMKQALESWLNGGDYKYYQYSDSGGFTVETGTFSASRIDTNKLVTAEWCQDLSVTSKAFFDSNWNEVAEDSDLAVYTDYHYGVYDRLYDTSTAQPSLMCNSMGSDGSSVNKIKSKIGVLTADEVAFAGGIFNNSGLTTAGHYYLMDNVSEQWTLSPIWLNDEVDYQYFYLSYVSSTGNLYGGNTIFDGSLRPSVVLLSSTEITGGNGTQSNPYVVK